MLHVHRAERADALVEALGGLLADVPADAFAREVVSVPTRGMERWLTQRMSARLGASPGRGDGVCANVVFPSPRRLVGDAVATASGIDADTDPWLPERSVWALLDVLDACLREPWLRGLATHLGATAGSEDPHRQARRFAVVRHLADLFDRYALHRPEMVRAWSAGRDDDGTGGKARQPEQRHARRQIEERRIVAQPRARAVDPLRRVGRRDARPQAPEQLGLPAELRMQPAAGAVLVAARGPRAHHLGTV